MKNIILTALIIGLIGTIGCKKDKTLSTKEMLIGKWNFIQQGTEKPKGTPETIEKMDATAFYTFQDNGEFSGSVGSSFTGGKWELINDEKTLHLTYLLNENHNASILKLDAHNLVFSFDYVDENNVTNHATL